jgi:radical SAM-linked protein
MEDFVGRGDRRLAPVIRRAWELGAGMDAWWESLDRAFSAWTQAIEESNLTWKYRQVESGEWNVFEAGENVYDAPLPWDHLDTGIDKEWLKADLQKALKAAIVPDCSFEGCSHCGVCGTDFGHNVVVPPLPIPAFTGQFVPNVERAQRLRVWFGKLGDMALTSHLDLIRLFDRALRRAAIPITFSAGFHPIPKFALANALSLGITSSGEIVDFDLTRSMDLQEFQAQFAAQLPTDMPIYRVEAVAPNSPSATQLLEQAEYVLTVGTEEGAAADWQTWVDVIWAAEELMMEQTTKSGQVKQVNLRDRLFALNLTTSEATSATLRYLGSCRNDGTLLRPEHIIYLLEQKSHQEIHLLHTHRQQLLLAET